MTTQQKRIIAAIVAITALLGGTILWSARETGGDHAEEAGHGATHAEAKKDAHADEKKDDHSDHAKESGQSEAATAAAPDRVAFSADQVRTAGVVIAEATLSEMTSTLPLPGEIRFDADRTAHVVPRVAGVVLAVPVRLGQQVHRGQLLATLSSGAVSDLRSQAESARQRLALAREHHGREQKLWDERISAEQDLQQARTALREAEIAVANAGQKLAALGASGSTSGAGDSFQIRAPFDGVVVEKHIAPGEMVREDTTVFTIADLRQVWAEIEVPASALDAVRVGAEATVKASAMNSVANGRIGYVGTLLGEQTRTAKAHVVLANPAGAWRPGMFVTVEVAAGAPRPVLTVPDDAIHTLEQRNVVFVAGEEGFSAQPVTTGQRQDGRTEILAGLLPGQRYAAVNAFLLKAELGKATAEHAH